MSLLRGFKSMKLGIFSFTLISCVAACGFENPKSAPSPLQNKNIPHSNFDSNSDEDAEHLYKPWYLDQATGKIDESLGRKSTYRWPFQLLSIGHTMASYQNYGGEAYFHHGLDIRGNAGTDVKASAGGEVVNVENYMSGSAYWEIAIKDAEGFIWQYHHIDHASIPKKILDAFKNHQQIPAGEKLGQIFYWGNSTFGERYHHIHLNILGEGGKYLNPFTFLDALPDTKAPVIVNVGLLQKGRAVSGSSVSGSYSLYATIHDLILHEKFVVPANRVTIQLDEGAEQEFWNFNNGLPGGASNTDYVDEFYVPSLTCGNYDCRKLTLDLGFAPSHTTRKIVHGSGIEFPSTPGAHKATLKAVDFVGNETQKDFSWTVR